MANILRKLYRAWRPHPSESPAGAPAVAAPPGPPTPRIVPVPFDRTIAPSVRRESGQRIARQKYFAMLYRRFQLEIPIVIHSLGLELDLPHEAQCICAFYASAHYLATLNSLDLPRPDYEALAQA